MALHNRGNDLFADTQADISAALVDYSDDSYLASRFADAVCPCGNRTFIFAIDETQGAAEHRCTACDAVALIANSAEVTAEMKLEQCTCACEGEIFEMTLGVALYAESSDVRWIYLGARCVACSLVGCYADWKSDGDPADAVLAKP